jgi:hypothetical protein
VFANALFRIGRVFVGRLWLTAGIAALNSHERLQFAHWMGISKAAVLSSNKNLKAF